MAIGGGGSSHRTTPTTPKATPLDHSACQDLASHMVHLKSLPEGCRAYADISADLQRRDSDTTHPTQFLS